jgi:hypothetical protein
METSKPGVQYRVLSATLFGCQLLSKGSSVWRQCDGCNCDDLVRNRTIKRTIDQPTTRPPSERGQHDMQFLRLCFHASPAQLPNPLQECARWTFSAETSGHSFLAFLNVWIDFHGRPPDLNLDGVYRHLHVYFNRPCNKLTSAWGALRWAHRLSPDQSGSKRRERGLAKAGNASVRRSLIQLAWRICGSRKIVFLRSGIAREPKSRGSHGE